MKAILCLTVLVSCVSYVYMVTPVLSTAWPEICRVMSLYRTCADTDYRVACLNYANCSTDCVGNGMLYLPTSGFCLGGTDDGEHVWPFAQEACSWYSGQLYIVKDAIDASVVTAYYTSGVSAHVNTLIGALNIGKTNQWVHLDGTFVDNSFWVGGGNAPTKDSVSQCMYSDSTNSYKQASEDCVNNYPFLCVSYPS